MKKILAVDIGQGTADIMLWDASKNLENQVKMVIPSPTKRYEEFIRAGQAIRELYIYGDTIGGGKLAKALKEAVRRGTRVVMTESAALTLNNELARVAEMNIEIKEFFHPSEEKFDFTRKPGEKCFLEFVEVELPLYIEFFEKLGLDILTVDAIAIAVQDHGDPAVGVSNRENRYRLFKEFLSKAVSPADMAFMHNELPKDYLRMNSALARIRRYFPSTPVMFCDTAMAAIFGIFVWREEAELPPDEMEPYVAINLGNNHTLAVIMAGGRIHAFLEHHTWAYREAPEKLVTHLRALSSGELDAAAMMADGGEGAFSAGRIEFDRLRSFIVTGPNRYLIRKSGLDYEMAEVGGDQMMTGPLGLIWALHRKAGIPFVIKKQG